MTSLAQGSAGVALVLAFAMLCPRQVDGALSLLTAQAAAVAVALLARHSVLPAVAELAFGAIAAQLAQRRLLGQLSLPHETSVPGGSHWVMVAGGILAVLALPFGDLGLPLAVVLLSLLLVATRRHPMMQIAGLAGLQNGIALLAAGQPPAFMMMAVLPVVPGLALLALWLQRRGMA